LRKNINLLTDALSLYTEVEPTQLSGKLVKLLPPNVRIKCTKFDFHCGSAPHPVGGVLPQTSSTQNMFCSTITDRQTERQTDTQTGRQTYRQPDRQTDILAVQTANMSCSESKKRNMISRDSDAPTGMNNA